MKEQTFSSTAMVVEDPVRVSLLADPGHAQFFLAFLAREASPGQVAKELGVSLSRVMYWITRAISAKLLVVSRTEARAGRPIRYYRCIADTLFLPAVATEEGTLVELLRLWSDPWQLLYVESVARAMQNAKFTGIRFSRTQSGRIEIKYASGPNTLADLSAQNMPAVWGGWYTDLWLDPSDAKQFQLELRDLQARYLAKRGRQRYIMRLALAPCAPSSLSSSE